MSIQHDAFAKFVAILGRGPGRSRALTREEAREAFGMVLRREADPHQVGAFLMLSRFRGEDADEIAGMVEAAQAAIADSWRGCRVDLDWPSYGAGRTRGAPWFLLSALALARAGATILMHGSNEYSAGIPVETALRALGMEPAQGIEPALGIEPAQGVIEPALGIEPAGAQYAAGGGGFTFVPLTALSPSLSDLLRLRRLFGLRSPVNTVARLLDPARARAGVDGVFHPAYLAVHLGVAERLGRPRLFVLKGGGGEAERVPLKPGTGWLWDAAHGQSEIGLSATHGLHPAAPAADTPELFTAVWHGDAAPPTAVATVVATIALGLLALGWAGTEETAMLDAARIWRGRSPAR